MSFAVRLSHVLGDAGVGAVVRDGEILYVVKDITYWADRHGAFKGAQLTRVSQVRSMLGIPQILREPPRASNDQEKGLSGYTVPVIPFPQWCYCSDCRQLQHWRYWEKEKATDLELPQCSSRVCLERVRAGKKKSLPKLQQVRWVLADEEGCLSDINWHGLTHQDAVNADQKTCRFKPGENYLQLIPSGSGGDRYDLFCENCRVRSKFRINERLPFHGLEQPWLRFPPRHLSDTPAQPSPSLQEKPPAFVLEINDARLYSSEQRSALVIPPESRMNRHSLSARVQQKSDVLTKLAEIPNKNSRLIHKRTFANELNCSIEELDACLEQLEQDEADQAAIITASQLTRLEYQALITPIPDLSPDEDFVTEHLSEDWRTFRAGLKVEPRLKQIAKLVDQVIAVRRLKRVNVQTGFRRLHGTLVSPAINQEAPFLPAVEFFGEGIFLTLDESILAQWESIPAVSAYEAVLKKRVEASDLQFSGQPPPLPLSRFILLHTLSHLLIRELEGESGYTAAALQERIYCESSTAALDSEDSRNMSGILISVTVPDVYGTLGGLVELCTPERLLRLLERAFAKVSWCSLDPVCSSHDGQGLYLLNRAACHGCAMVPEPSCAYGNLLLDRLLLDTPFGQDGLNRPPGLLSIVDE